MKYDTHLNDKIGLFISKCINDKEYEILNIIVNLERDIIKYFIDELDNINDINQFIFRIKLHFLSFYYANMFVHIMEHYLENKYFEEKSVKLIMDKLFNNSKAYIEDYYLLKGNSNGEEKTKH